jgi:RHS repeat-associated protein
LSYNSYSRENSIYNKWKFQGEEHVDDLNLGWDSFKWRNHQSDIGRFFNIDPLADKYVYNSPYAFSENKVTSHIELEGTEALDFMTHWALYGPRAVISYPIDWLHDKIIGGGVRMAQGAQQYAQNETEHQQYQRQSSEEQIIPEHVEELQYYSNKVEATGKMVKGLVDQGEGYNALVGLFSGGAEAVAVREGTKGAAKTFNNMVKNMLTDTRSSADNVAAEFTEAGYKSTVSEMRSGRGHMITIEGHAEINTIKIHGGGGRHQTARVQIIGQNNSLDLKIVNGSRSSYRGNIAEEEKAGRRFIFTEQ